MFSNPQAAVSLILGSFDQVRLHRIAFYEAINLIEVLIRLRWVRLKPTLVHMPRADQVVVILPACDMRYCELPYEAPQVTDPFPATIRNTNGLVSGNNLTRASVAWPTCRR
ncbi:MAG TPA: hypothetical protein PKD64_13030 [Pirellulaceae bacterium]|nr:hypothetical protein [Pirellulaceae bacterium]